MIYLQDSLDLGVPYLEGNTEERRRFSFRIGQCNRILKWQNGEENSLDFFGKSTVEIERDENNKSGIEGNNLNRTNSGDSATDDNENVSVHENETDKGAHTELTCKNGYCKIHTCQNQKFIELNRASH